MATAVTVIERWIAGNEKKAVLYKSVPSLVLSWVNDAQGRYADVGEVLQDVWEPTITSSGNIVLPTDFLREVKDRVYWDANICLQQIDYPTAQLMDFSTTGFYSVWQGYFYVWVAAAGSPKIPYLKVPATITYANIGTTALEIPSEGHDDLLIYMDAMWARKNDDISGSMSLLKLFDQAASKGGSKFRARRNPVPRTMGGFF